MNKKINISEPSLDEEEWMALREPIFDGWLTQGPRVQEFETQFSKVHEVRNALATTSCTTALHLMMVASNIGPGDEVIVPSFTWVATANAVLYVGATPVFADVDLETNNINFHDILSRVTERTKAVIVVHLFGLCVDVSILRELLPEHIEIFEDAACAVGASINGKMAGSMGKAAAFSFHPRKILTTGEGGMVTTNDEKFSELVNSLRSHGATISEEVRHKSSKPYLLPEFNVLGFNYRMSDLQGAVGIVQLSKLETFLNHREKIAQYYIDQLNEFDSIQVPVVPAIGKHSWQSFVIRFLGKDAAETRNNVMEALEKQSISTRPGTHAIHMLGYYKDKFTYKESDYPNSALCSQTTMAIPMHNQLKDQDLDKVILQIKRLIK